MHAPMYTKLAEVCPIIDILFICSLLNVAVIKKRVASKNYSNWKSQNYNPQ